MANTKTVERLNPKTNAEAKMYLQLMIDKAEARVDMIRSMKGRFECQSDNSNWYVIQRVDYVCATSQQDIIDKSVNNFWSEERANEFIKERCNEEEDYIAVQICSDELEPNAYCKEIFRLAEELL